MKPLYLHPPDRAALAEPKAEPVAWMLTADQFRRPPEFYRERPMVPPISTLTPLYANPPAERRPMTSEEAADLIDRWRLTSASCINLIRAVERHHGIGCSDE